LKSLTKVPDRQEKGQDDEHERDDTQYPDDRFLAARGSGIEHRISGWYPTEVVQLSQYRRHKDHPAKEAHSISLLAGRLISIRGGNLIAIKSLTPRCDRPSTA